MIWPDPTHWSTDPATHLLMGGGLSTNHKFCTDFKSSNRIEFILISSSVIKFLLIPGVPGWIASGWIGLGVGMGVWGCPMHAHTHMHTHTCTYMLNMINMDASMGVAICNFYTCIHVHVCMCACACMHVHMCGTPPIPPNIPHLPVPPLEPQGVPKHQNSISLELIEIFRFCLKILYLQTFLNSYKL